MPPPPSLKRYLAFSKFSSRSLEAVARAVERDEVFRRRVADAVDEEQVGRAGWLWLARPEGWRDQLDALEATAAAEAADLEEQRAERAASKQLVAAQEAVRRADAQVAAQIVELEELRAQLIQEREARAGAEVRAEELAERIDAVTAARGKVVRNLKDTEARLVERATEAKAAKARIRALEAEAEVRERRKPVGSGSAHASAPSASPAPSAPSSVEGDPTPTAPRRGDTGDAGHAPASGTVVGQAPGSQAVPSPNAGEPGDDEAARRVPAVGVDHAAIVGEVARAAQGAATLSAALNDLAALLAGGAVPARPDPGLASPAGSALSGADGHRAPEVGRDRAGVAPNAGTTAPPVTRARREPLALPGGMFDDTVEAAEHLLRTPGAALVVDGYNVTMAGWPELGAAAQRRRLVVALSDLAARTSTQVELVFDGAEVEPLAVPTPTRQLVRVRFSDPGIEADDVVIDLVARLPAATPVIVASSDKRVRAGARRWGANLLHARQLVDVLRR